MVTLKRWCKCTGILMLTIIVYFEITFIITVDPESTCSKGVWAFEFHLRDVSLPVVVAEFDFRELFHHVNLAHVLGICDVPIWKVQISFVTLN